MSLLNVSFTTGELLEVIEELDPMRNDRYTITDDLTAGKLYSDVFAEVLRYNTTLKLWMAYNGIIWVQDEGNAVAEKCAQRLSRMLSMYVTKTIPDEPKESEKRYRAFVNSLGDRHKRLKMIDDAKPWLSVQETDFDKDPDLLNCRNCIINLRTMEQLPHDGKLLLSKVCNVTYDPGAKHTKWMSFIRGIMLDDQDKIDYLQRVLGYGLLGTNEEEKCFIFYGKSTRNGKSTLIETVSYMLGDYAKALPPEALAQKVRDSSRPNEEIARLRGVRFVHVSEPSKRMIFDVALMKNLTGGDTQTASFKYGHFFEYHPVYKIYMNTNYLPAVNDDTIFSSDRVQVLTFDKHFSREEQDRQLKQSLRSARVLSAMLVWLLDGLQKYREKGVVPPQSVIDATNDYRKDSDKFGKFYEECLVYSVGTNAKVKIVYEAYSKWCSDNGYGVEKKGEFITDLKLRGMFSDTGTVCGRTERNVVKNYRLTNEALREIRPYV